MIQMFLLQVTTLRIKLRLVRKFDSMDQVEDNVAICTIDNVEVAFSTSSSTLWMQLESGGPAVGIAVFNPYNGPGSAVSSFYQTEIYNARTWGVKVIGYVHTQYGQRSLTDVLNDIDTYFDWYDQVGGIFVDEASNRCSRISYYQTIYDHIKTLDPSATVVVNPGGLTQECYVSVADILLNFEDVYSAYTTWKPMGWEQNYPANKFWHLIFSTSSRRMSNAVNLAKSRNAGWIYVTPDTLPNPWDTLPTDPYWSDELNLISQ
jgi:hypothetical protein